VKSYISDLKSGTDLENLAGDTDLNESDGVISSLNSKDSVDSKEI